MYNNIYEKDSRIPFVTPTDKWRPKSWQDALSLCGFFLMKNPAVASVLSKAAEYPITDIVVKCSDKIIEKSCIAILEENNTILKLKDISRSLKFFGNVPVVVYFPFKRKLKCPKCKQSFNLKKDGFDYNAGVFSKKCSCGYSGEHEIDDVIDKAQSPKIIEMDMRNFDVVKNDFNDEYFFYYQLPRKEYRKLSGKSTDFNYLKKVPKDYIASIKNKKKILYDETKLLYIRNSCVKGNMLFDFIGVPDIYWVLDDIFFNSTLKKSDQITVTDKMQGMSYMSPAQPNQSGGAGNASVSMELFVKHIKAAEARRKIDPNETQILPYPIYYGRAGGDGKSSLNIQERQFTTEDIINGLGYPMEFLKGGMQWSGSSVTLRMLENMFLNYRTYMLNLMKFYVKKLALFKGWSEVPEISFKNFKMADDIQQRSTDINLASNNKMSWTTVLANQGVNYIEEMQRKLEEGEIELKVIEMEAKKNAIGVKLSTKAQVEGQMETSRSKIEATLRNSDGSDNVKDLEFTGSDVMNWKANNFPIGGLSSAITSEIQDAQYQFNESSRQQMEQFKMQAQMQGQQQGQEGQGQEQPQGQEEQPQGQEEQPQGQEEQPQGQEQQDNIGNIISVIDAARSQGAPEDDIKAYLMNNGVSEEEMNEAFRVIDQESIVGFIKQKTEEGSTEEEIVNTLHEYGYSEEEINEAYGTYDSESQQPQEEQPQEEVMQEDPSQVAPTQEQPVQELDPTTEAIKNALRVGYKEPEISAHFKVRPEIVTQIRGSIAINEDVISLFGMLLSLDNTTRDKYIEEYKSSRDIEGFDFDRKYNAFEIILKSTVKGIDPSVILSNLKSLGYISNEDMTDFVKKSLYYVDATENNKKMKFTGKANSASATGNIATVDDRPMPEKLPPRR